MAGKNQLLCGVLLTIVVNVYTNYQIHQGARWTPCRLNDGGDTRYLNLLCMEKCRRENIFWSASCHGLNRCCKMGDVRNNTKLNPYLSVWESETQPSPEMMAAQPDIWPPCVVDDGGWNVPYANTECLPECEPEDRFINGLCHRGLTCCKYRRGPPCLVDDGGSRPYANVECWTECRPEDRFINGICPSGRMCCKLGSK